MEAQKTTNAQGSDVLTKSAYITVTEPGSVNYCESASLSDTDEYIPNVAIGRSFHNSSGGSPSSCETFSIGEVEDYKGSIVQPKIAFGGEERTFTFSIYPNPANERVNLLIEGLNDFKLNIFNSAGELMYEKIGKSGSTEINTSDFPSGVFYIRIRSGLNQFVEKFIKI